MKKDKETIAGWRSGLEKILEIFNVRSVARVMTVADFPPQEALAINIINTDPVVSAANTHKTIPGAQNDVVKTPAIVSDSHRNALKGPEGMHGQNRMVSTIRILPAVE